MSKNLFQDMKPIRRTTSNNIVPFTLHKKSIFEDIKKEVKLTEEKEELKQEQEQEETREVTKKETKIEPREESIRKYEAINRKILSEMNGDDNKRKGSRYGLWFVAVIALVFFVFAVSSLFTKARVVVNPKIQDMVLNQTFSAVKDSNISRVLSFNLISLSGEEEKIVNTGEEKDYSQKAKGTIMLYNNFSDTSQKLVIDTRLEGSNGKIYKTEKAVIIPGIKDNKPGSIEIDIYANEPGEDYNTSPIDFKILGFKGSAKYEKFYGRSKGDISGGLVGKLRLVGEEDKAKAIEELNMTLQDKLFKKATIELPEGYILFKDAVIFKIDDESGGVASALNQDEVSVKIKGTLYGFLFEEKNLTNKIVETIIPKYDGSEVYIPKIKDFVIAISKEGTLFSFADIKNINFNLSGVSQIVWNTDEDKLKSVLVDKPKKDFEHILSQYPNIDFASLVLRPIWRRDMPSDMKDIKIIVNYPE